MDVFLYSSIASIPAMYRDTGGQALIVNEIIAALSGCSYIWLPFRSDGMLEQRLTLAGFQTHCTEDFDKEGSFVPLPEGIDGVYFGTPTIVKDKVLFRRVRDADWWTKERERMTARAIAWRAEQMRFKRIISGLGSGDISVPERLADMGPRSDVICFKRFADFDDYVLARRLDP